MKKRFLSIILTFCMLLSFMPLIPVTAAEGGVEINVDNFPDANFRDYVEENFDIDKDYFLTSTEISNVTTIDVTKRNITDLTGVGLFTNVTELKCPSNKLTSLDLSENTALTTLDCYNNQLTSLDLSKNTALTTLDYSGNQFTSLDLSKNTTLKELYCYRNQLTSLDLSKNTELTTLNCYNNQLTSLDLSKNTELTTLACFGNQFTSLDLSKNTELTTLECYNNQLTSLDLSKNTALTTLYCNGNQLTSLDLSKNTELTKLYCHTNQLTSLDLSKNTELTTLACYSNQLTSLDLSKNTELTTLRCYSNQLTSLDLSKNTELTTLYCNDNRYKIDLVGDTFELSTLPTGFDIKNASNWKNATVNDNILTVSDPTKNVTYTYNLGNNKTTTFSLFWDSYTITANMIASIADQIYTNTDIEPEITITCGSYTLISGEDYTVSYENNKNVGTATATVTGKGDFYKGTVSVTFNIVKATPVLDTPIAKNSIPYGEKLNNVGLPTGWTWADGNTVPTVTNSGYTAYYTPADTANYDWTAVEGWNASENRVERTVAVTFNKAEQNAPTGLSGTAETIDGKADGKITGVTSAMEYRKDGTIDYTAITGTEITGLADGKYYVRYKADANHNASADTEVMVAAGRKLTVNVPNTQVGYTLTVNKTELVWNDSVELTFALANGYSKLNNFAVNVNGNPIALDTNGKCTVPNAQSDITVTVIGVADITAPTGEIALGKNSWKTFLNNITFGLFFKDAQEVTITANDNSGEVVKIEYLLSDKELTAAELATATFTAYSDKFNINPNNEYVIYAKLTDNSDNVTYINSNGIVLDNIVPVISGIVNGETYCEAQTVTVRDKYEVTVTVNGTPVTLDANGQFTLTPASGTQTVVATDKAGNASAEMIVTVNDGHETDTPATCIKKAVCKHCGLEYGNLNPSNHENESDEWTTKNATQHKKEWTCCHTVTAELANHTWNENGTCTECGYGCVHTGGEATCKAKAKCKHCGLEYGEVDNSNHDLENIKESVATVTETGNTEYWHCKDCDNNFSDKDGKTKIDLKNTVTPKLPPEIIDGKGQSLTAGEKKELTFRSNAAYSDFIRVEVDGKVVDEKNYTVKEGSTIVTLKADYVATLSTGEHTLGIVSQSGTATTTFTVNAKAVDTNSPQTGDNSHMALWFALLFVSGGALVGTAAYGKKRKRFIK